jgi:hypothetical protein
MQNKKIMELFLDYKNLLVEFEKLFERYDSDDLQLLFEWNLHLLFCELH